MLVKSLLKENVIIILNLNQSEWRKLLRSASSWIGFERSGYIYKLMSTAFFGNSRKAIQGPVLSLLSHRTIIATQ